MLAFLNTLLISWYLLVILCISSFIHITWNSALCHAQKGVCNSTFSMGFASSNFDCIIMYIHKLESPTRRYSVICSEAITLGLESALSSKSKD